MYDDQVYNNDAYNLEFFKNIENFDDEEIEKKGRFRPVTGITPFDMNLNSRHR